MKNPIVVIGVGEMGGVFARGFLRLGHPVYPVTRSMSAEEVAQGLPEPDLVLVAVAEGDLRAVLEALPRDWADRLCLLQNELLPADWAGFDDPTVISVWFEKKPGQDAKVIIPSPVFGPRAALVSQALDAVAIPTQVLIDPDQLLFELVVKNLYILTANIAGIAVGGTVGELMSRHSQLTRDLADDVMDVQATLTGRSLDRGRLFEAMLAAFRGDPDHKCMGRSAPARLARALAQADAEGLEVPSLRAIAREHGVAVGG
jgi:ketopantoate reductase